MSIASDVTRMLSLPDIERSGNVVKTAWDRLAPLPGGRRLFSTLIGRMAPYTGTIGATVEELREGYARVSMRDRPGVRNHLRSVHAVALANLVELTGNVALAYGLPDDARFIVAGMHLEYLKKARGTLVGEGTPPPVTSSERRELDVPVVLRDASGDEVVRGRLRSLVGPKTR